MEVNTIYLREEILADLLDLLKISKINFQPKLIFLPSTKLILRKINIFHHPPNYIPAKIIMFLPLIL